MTGGAADRPGLPAGRPAPPASAPRSGVASVIFHAEGFFSTRESNWTGAILLFATAAAVAAQVVRVWLTTGHLPLVQVGSLASLPFLVLVGTAFLTRRPPIEQPRPGELLVPLASLVSPAILLNIGLLVPPTDGTWLGLPVALVGMILACGALLAIRTSFAILPAVRGIVHRGPYAAIRHPLYLGEFVYTVGVVLVQFSWIQVLGLVIVAGLFAARIRIEERKLMAQPSYAAYARVTRFRLLPGIW